MAHSASASAPVPLDSCRQLFLDDFLIASSANVRRTIHPARKFEGNPVLRPDKPWEDGRALLFGSVLREKDRYRMWYFAGARGTAIAESADGIVWTKPELDAVKLGGRKTNLVVYPDKLAEPPLNFFECFGVSRDDREPDPARRYKQGYLAFDRQYGAGPFESRFHPGQRRGLGVLGSPDGIHWTAIEPWATQATCDGVTTWMWDPRRARYVLYGRTQHRAPETVAAWSPNDWYRAGNPRLWHWGRSVARAESPDFVRWDYTAPASAPVVLTADARDPACTEFYSVMVFPYESVYIGLLQNFRSSPDTCWIDIQLVVSRDTASFTRVGDRAPFLPLGGLGEWDRFNHSLANNPPLAVGDDLRFYYSGRRGRHDPYGTLKDYAQPDVGVSDGSIGFASVRRDRFVSLGASFDGGELVTRPLDVRGSALFLNGKADHGEILVEALDPSGAVLARAHPWRADSLSRAVAWPSGGLPGAGAPMRFRITLRNALLYALWAE